MEPGYGQAIVHPRRYMRNHSSERIDIIRTPRPIIQDEVFGGP